MLEATGLLTRTFSRHFQSKDAVLLALFRRDSERINPQLEAAVTRILTAELEDGTLAHHPGGHPRFGAEARCEHWRSQNGTGHLS